MRRLLVFALVQAFAVSAATGAALHVHQYVGHDHPEHHHGPASHEHHHSTPADPDHPSEGAGEDHPAVQAESCDPDRHVVAVTLGCAQVPQMHIHIVGLPGPTLIAPTAPICSATAITDVRVHGPPFDARIPSRAPPLTHLA